MLITLILIYKKDACTYGFKFVVLNKNCKITYFIDIKSSTFLSTTLLCFIQEGVFMNPMTF